MREREREGERKKRNPLHKQKFGFILFDLGSAFLFVFAARMDLLKAYFLPCFFGSGRRKDGLFLLEAYLIASLVISNLDFAGSGRSKKVTTILSST